MNKPNTISKTCPDCGGQGWYPEGDKDAQCETCGGTGKIEVEEDEYANDDDDFSEEE